MSVTLYGIANCDTCRKARKWLEQRAIAHEFHDLRADGLPADRVRRWLKALPDTDLVNRRSTTWRSLDEATRSRAGTDIVGLLCEHPTLMKRPVLESGSRVLQGFNDEHWADWLGVAS